MRGGLVVAREGSVAERGARRACALSAGVGGRAAVAADAVDAAAERPGDAYWAAREERAPRRRSQ